VKPSADMAAAPITTPQIPGFKLGGSFIDLMSCAPVSAPLVHPGEISGVGAQANTCDHVCKELVNASRDENARRLSRPAERPRLPADRHAEHRALFRWISSSSSLASSVIFSGPQGGRPDELDPNIIDAGDGTDGGFDSARHASGDRAGGGRQCHFDVDRGALLDDQLVDQTELGML
jgi:hypothetical protein